MPTHKVMLITKPKPIAKSAQKILCKIPKEYKSISAPLPSHMFYVTEYRPLLTLPLSCHYSQNLSKVAEMLVPFNP